MNKKLININGRPIGPGHPPYVIAELSGNHNGDIDRALSLIEAAKVSGADAVKLQTYTADTMTIDHDGADFQIHGGLWDGYSLYALYEEAYTPWEWHEALFSRGKELGITVFSTPFDTTSVDFLETLNPPAYKIASFEIIDLPLIKKVASMGRPMIISTGMADEPEIAEAVETARNNGCDELVLLHCVSGYPAPIKESNLNTITDIAKRYDVLTGLSDHTLGITVSIAGVALGACIIEKHFTLARTDGGPDADFSLEPTELKALVTECRNAYDAVGTAGYARKKCEEPNVIFRRSIYVVSDIKAGETFNNANIRTIRPGHGLPPRRMTDVLGKTAKTDITRGTPLSEDHFDE